jgi:recombination DNA repair RAD52 pathway protein
MNEISQASISDARKRALRLFGEHLGNSCYDREVNFFCLNYARALVSLYGWI